MKTNWCKKCKLNSFCCCVVATLMKLFLMGAIIMIFCIYLKKIEHNHSSKEFNMLKNTRTYTLEKSLFIIQRVKILHNSGYFKVSNTNSIFIGVPFFFYMRNRKQYYYILYHFNILMELPLLTSFQKL